MFVVPPRLYLALRFMAVFGWCFWPLSILMSAQLQLHKWLCYAESRSVGHFKRLDVADVGCAATLKTQDFQLLFRFSYIINKLDGFVTAHKGWGSQRSICRIWFTDKVDCSFHVFQRYLIVSCHLWHLKNVFWSIISSISSIANRKIDFASSLLTEIINFISVP